MRSRKLDDLNPQRAPLSTTEQTQVALEERRADVLRLLNLGMSRSDVARKLEMSLSQVDADYRIALDDARSRRMAIADVLLDDQLSRLDDVLYEMAALMRDGDPHAKPKAAAQVLEALDQRARLLNLYPAPEKIGAGQNTEIAITWNVVLPSLETGISGQLITGGKESLPVGDMQQGQIIDGDGLVIRHD
ncbi:MAG: hypothetical protein EBR82_51055 [Caulobacteraceae bacterium]|nr:hypothetical protein [Caulobacteraceae bacterium]